MGQFESFAAFIDMGGHGLYVWLCYAIGLAVITYNIVSASLVRKKAELKLKKFIRRQQLERS